MDREFFEKANETILERMHLDTFIKDKEIHFLYNERPCRIAYDTYHKEYYVAIYGSEFKDAPWWDCRQELINLFKSPTGKYSDTQLEIAWEFANRHILKNMLPN